MAVYGIGTVLRKAFGFTDYFGQATSEISIEGMEQFEELRELILGFVRGKKPVAVETYEEEGTNQKILNEVVKMRKMLEKSSGK